MWPVLELPWRDNARNRSYIPAGEYLVLLHRSPRFGRCLLAGSRRGRLIAGATGLLGVGLRGVTSYFEREQRHGQELELRKLDLRLTQAEEGVAERVAAGAASARAAAALEASLRSAATRWSNTSATATGSC